MKDIIVTHENLNRGKLRYKHLLGKPFSMGKTDCYTMLCRMYEDNLNIELTNYARPDGWWLEEGVDLYLDNYKSEGFSLVVDAELADLRPFDVLLIAIPDPRNTKKTKVNHCAIYLGEGMVIHHRLGTLSSVVPYRGWVRNFTTHVIRHKDVVDMTPKTVTEIDIMDRLLPHKRELLLGALNESGRE